MPLLKRKAFEKSTASGYLRDDDEVFHCEITDEIFKDYEEYCERIILVNSMVWSCEMTGKNNLTYAEALESEKAARKSLKDFPMELRIPILYLAAKTKRCSFAEMSEDVFNYVRERFFVGETVEACLEGELWVESHVLSVTAQKQAPGSKVQLPASSYCYEVEQFDEEDAAGGQVSTVPPDRVRRRKGVYTRDKNRLFLKQFVMQDSGLICIKKPALDKYNIHKTNFDQIFTGYPPEFPSSKKLLKPSISPLKTPGKAGSKPGTASKPGSATKPGSAAKAGKGKKPSPDKKGKQESMDKFVKKTDRAEATKKPVDPAAKNSAKELAEKMRRAEDQMRKRKEEEKAKKKEKTARLQAYLKEWQKVKDDLDLEDHKVLPKGTPIDVEGIPHKHFGDFLSVLEFVHIFADVIKTKDVFHNGLDLEAFRKALTLKEHAGVFSDLVQMFLTAIFSLQEDEAEDYNETKGIQESTGSVTVDAAGAVGAVERGTLASKWSQTYLGTPLSQLPLDPTTVSEVLRLHLLSSGSAAGSRCATWRYHQRGGYSSHDDPGLRLRVAHPDLIRRLATAHVADLDLDDKFLILQCLMNQLLTYATVRDIIEEKLEELRTTKHALRVLLIGERKREAQIIVSRQEIKKDFAAKKEEQKLTGDKAKAHDEQLKVALEKLAKESEEKKVEYEKKQQELQAKVFDYASYLGSDRAHRRYWLNQRVAGVFVEGGSGAGPAGGGGATAGGCRERPVRPAPPLPAGQGTLAYVTTLFESTAADRERASSDKENDSTGNSRNSSPKKPLGVNGVNGVKPTAAAADQTERMRELLMCTGDAGTCLVHGESVRRPRWWVYHTAEQIDGVLAALNPRGIREAELRAALATDRTRIAKYLEECPLHALNAQAAPPPAIHHMTRNKKFAPSLAVPADCSLAEALELSLRDHILELEEKIFHGCLGAIKVKDREAWRGTLMLRGYDKQTPHLSWGPAGRYRDDYHLPGGRLQLPKDLDKSALEAIPENKYRDPGHYLDSETPAAEAATVRQLAAALLQVAQAVHHKYLKRPLGLDEKERKDREARNKSMDLEALERWEVSLMECRSFAAVVLHLFTLDSSVTWSASILNASCRLCRRKTDPDNMLLCDGCNKGHHLYCLKPKLTKVPSGDWFCDQCKPKERTPRKRRKLFSEEEIEEALNSDDDSLTASAGLVCASCGSGGRLAAECSTCGNAFHAECATPKAARHVRRWQCAGCLAPTRESDDSDDNTVLVKLKTRKPRASDVSPVPNGVAGNKRGRKSKSELDTSSSKKSKTSLTNGHHVPEEKLPNGRTKRSSGRGGVRTEVLTALLKDVSRHRDAWPFQEPVSVEDVPDYLQVISEPMDFTTMQEKLDRGEYTTESEVLADAALVLNNCFTYNKDTHPVAKAGVRLERYINKRCSELELPALPATSSGGGGGDGDGKRGPSSEPHDTPRAKKPKLK